MITEDSLAFDLFCIMGCQIGESSTSTTFVKADELKVGSCFWWSEVLLSILD